MVATCATRKPAARRLGWETSRVKSCLGQESGNRRTEASQSDYLTYGTTKAGSPLNEAGPGAARTRQTRRK